MRKERQSQFSYWMPFSEFSNSVDCNGAPECVWARARVCVCAKLGKWQKAAHSEFSNIHAAICVSNWMYEYSNKVSTWICRFSLPLSLSWYLSYRLRQICIRCVLIIIIIVAVVVVAVVCRCHRFPLLSSQSSLSHAPKLFACSHF